MLVFSKPALYLKTGKELTIPIDQLNSYSVDGKVFNKLPLYKMEDKRSKWFLWNFSKTQGELSLIGILIIFMNHLPPTDETYPTYWIYNGDKLHLAVTDKIACRNISKYFDVKIYI